MNLETEQQQTCIYNSNSNMMIQDMNKKFRAVHAVVARRKVYDSSFWTSKKAYETYDNRLQSIIQAVGITHGKTMRL